MILLVDELNILKFWFFWRDYVIGVFSLYNVMWFVLLLFGSLLVGGLVINFINWYLVVNVRFVIGCLFFIIC